jgi:hypothetical protein
MPFNPNEPQNGEVVDADFLRAQFNALNDKIGTPKLPDFSTIAQPVPGNLAFNYDDEVLVVYGQGRWCTVATD